MRFTTIFFDLDDTLYPSNAGLWLAIKNRMNDYMRERMNIPADEIPALREKYYLQYGTTLHGSPSDRLPTVTAEPVLFLSFRRNRPAPEKDRFHSPGKRTR